VSVSSVTTRPPATSRDALARAREQLSAVAPDLRDHFDAQAGRAQAVVRARLLSAAWREGLAEPDRRAQRFAFGRYLTPADATGDPAALAHDLVGAAADEVAVELADAMANLSVAYARRTWSDAVTRRQARGSGARDVLDLAAPLDADAQCVLFERLATEGHNLHPCGRTRLGWDVADLLRHDLESPGTSVGLVAVRRDLHLGDDIGAALADAYPELAHHLDRTRYAVTPVHAWQLDRLLPARYGDLIADGALVPIGGARLAAMPTAALRTLLLPPDQRGKRRYLKLSLDIQVTSTRRTISVASTRNGPAISALLRELFDDDPDGHRIVLFDEVAGSAVSAGDARERDLAAIARAGLSGRLASDEVAVPGIALYSTSPLTGTTVLAELVDRYALTRGVRGRAAAARGFVTEYARLLLPAALRLATEHGIGLEAHLQNCVPTFVAGVPHRLALRDFAGMRIHAPRLRRTLRLWPGSVIAAGDVTTMLSKVGYTALQAHLGEVILQLVVSHGLDEAAAWSVVREIIDEVYGPLRAGPHAAAAAVDHAFLTAATMPHKALLRMRLDPAGGDRYVPVDNPLHRP
jgi:D-ornithine---citrate ligase